MDHKNLKEFKVKDNGTVEAVFATLNVRDHDGDVTVPGAFEQTRPVTISPYNHASIVGGALPAGKAMITADDVEAKLSGSFFMQTTQGKDTFEVVREMGPDQQWSYGYDVLDAVAGEKDGQAVQFLRKLDVYEVSPVIRGAGINTRTTAVKSFDGKGMTDDQFVAAFDVACKQLTDRGLPFPEAVLQAAREIIVEEADEERVRSQMYFIAGAHGIVLTPNDG